MEVSAVSSTPRSTDKVTLRPQRTAKTQISRCVLESICACLPATVTVRFAPKTAFRECRNTTLALFASAEETTQHDLSVTCRGGCSC